jgi:ABC-2 type transport system permease protein
MLLVLLLELALTAFAPTAFGVMLAARMSDVQSFQVVTQLFVLPMFFLSGAMFPVTQLPTWLTVLSKLDPLSDAVDPLRPRSSPSSPFRLRSGSPSTPGSAGAVGICRW